MAVKKKKSQEDEGKGLSLDDAFADDDDVEYAKPKPQKKAAKKQAKEKPSEEVVDVIHVKGTGPITKLKKGDTIIVDGLKLTIDTHYILMDHGTTKEMAIECFDPKKDEDYQLRYFNDQVETSLEVYKLVEIIYNKIPVKKIEW